MILNFMCYASKDFMSRYNVLEASIRRQHPNSMILCIDPGTNTPLGTYVPNMAKDRLREALKCLEDGFTNIVVLGADCELFAPLTEIQSLLETEDIILIPHVKSPQDDRSKMAALYKTGHANADVMVFKNTENAKDALRWLIEVTEGEDKDRGIFYEQTWLSALPFLFPHVHILRHPGYNVGYWDVVEAGLKLVNNEWLLEDGSPLKIFQYSGFVKGEPEKLSRHQRRHEAVGDILKFYEAYDEKI